jgi:hypothetical protein
MRLPLIELIRVLLNPHQFKNVKLLNFKECMNPKCKNQNLLHKECCL